MCLHVNHMITNLLSILRCYPTSRNFSFHLKVYYNQFSHTRIKQYLVYCVYIERILAFTLAVTCEAKNKIEFEISLGYVLLKIDRLRSAGGRFVNREYDF